MSKSISTRAPQQGQVMVLGLGLIFISVAMIAMLYNTGQSATEKIRLVNAADAAVYSGGVYVARNLNFMAYTNRAMIANHVAVGHFISYMSWARYSEVAGDPLAAIGWLPYSGWAPGLAKMTGPMLRGNSDIQGRALIPRIEGINEGLGMAQRAAKASLASGIASTRNVSTGPKFPIQEIMDTAAREHAGTIVVNNLDDMEDRQGGVTSDQITREMGAIYNLTQRYDPLSDNGRISQLSAASLGASQEWMTNRGWSESGAWNLKVEKRGNTRTDSVSLVNWHSEDKLIESRYNIRLGRWNDNNLARSQAQANEFSLGGAYDPFKAGYYDLEQSRVGKGREITLGLTAQVTMPVSKTIFREIFGMESGVQSLAAVSRASVFHRRPLVDFTSLKRGEYANLYNPFWQARLTNRLTPSTGGGGTKPLPQSIPNPTTAFN